MIERLQTYSPVARIEGNGATVDESVLLIDADLAAMFNFSGDPSSTENEAAYVTEMIDQATEESVVIYERDDHEDEKADLFDNVDAVK